MSPRGLERLEGSLDQAGVTQEVVLHHVRQSRDELPFDPCPQMVGIVSKRLSGLPTPASVGRASGIACQPKQDLYSLPVSDIGQKGYQAREHIVEARQSAETHCSAAQA